MERDTNTKATWSKTLSSKDKMWYRKVSKKQAITLELSVKNLKKSSRPPFCPSQDEFYFSNRKDKLRKLNTTIILVICQCIKWGVNLTDVLRAKAVHSRSGD